MVRLRRDPEVNPQRSQTVAFVDLDTADLRASERICSPLGDGIVCKYVDQQMDGRRCRIDILDKKVRFVSMPTRQISCSTLTKSGAAMSAAENPTLFLAADRLMLPIEPGDLSFVTDTRH